MTPQEKAKELLNRFQTMLESPFTKGLMYQDATRCALICCDEIMAALPTYPHIEGEYIENGQDSIDSSQRWYKQVKEEIEKL